ncbi:MAG: hypothetical protein EOO68_12055, partial [Moraxellaceae bacterium]
MTSKPAMQLNDTVPASHSVDHPTPKKPKNGHKTTITAIISGSETRQKTKLEPFQLTRLPTLDQIPASTRRIKPLNDFLGQQRARAAVE